MKQSADYFDRRTGGPDDESRLPTGLRARVEVLAADPKWIAMAHAALQDVRVAQRDIIATWAGVLLQTNKLANLFNKVATVVEGLDSGIVHPLWHVTVSDTHALAPAGAKKLARHWYETFEGSIENRETLNVESGVKKPGWTSPYRAHVE